MSDPTLKRTSIVVKYTSSDGYRLEYGGKAGTGTKHRVTGEEVPPQACFIAAFGELARILSLFGFEEQARKASENSFAAVREWRETRETKEAS